MKKVLLNADVGEEAGFDDQIMPYVSWCNVACGVHAGTDEEIKKTINLAIQHNVKIGAHPSYPDRENFGRVSMKISHGDLVKTLTDQIYKVKKFTEEAGAILHHVKPHGALYNDVVKNKGVASAIIDSINNIDRSLFIISPKDSVISYFYKDDFEIKHEVFADRNYNDDLTLVSRSEDDAVIENPEKVFNHVWKMISEEKVKTISGEEVDVFFDTICVHGDNPKSVEILKYMYKELMAKNYVLK